MVDCGFLIEWYDAKGQYHFHPCASPSCIHQPITEYRVTACELRRVAGLPPAEQDPAVGYDYDPARGSYHFQWRWHFVGQVATREEALMLEIRPPWNMDRFMTSIEQVQLCRWPVTHPRQLED